MIWNGDDRPSPDPVVVEIGIIDSWICNDLHLIQHTAIGCNGCDWIDYDWIQNVFFYDEHCVCTVQDLLICFYRSICCCLRSKFGFKS